MNRREFARVCCGERQTTWPPAFCRQPPSARLEAARLGFSRCLSLVVPSRARRGVENSEGS